MSDGERNTDIDIEHILDAYAEESGAETDPLKAIIPEIEAVEERTDTTVIDLYLAAKVEPRNITENTKQHHRRALNKWHEHMVENGRHPACANEYHIKGFIEKRLFDVGNHPETVKRNVRAINAFYQWLALRKEFSHPQNYNPIEAVHSEYQYKAAISDNNQSKGSSQYYERGETPRLTLTELREVVDAINHIRHRAIIVLQFKLGLRARELCNIKIEDIHISNAELQEYYPEIGTHPRLQNPRTGEPYENVIVIPHNRRGNKSRQTRLIPLDDEARYVFLQYLRIRPDNDRPWVFLTLTRHNQIAQSTISEIWINEFWARAPVERPERLASHFGRKYFTTFWRVHQDLPREKVQYLRGDRIGGHEHSGRPEAIDAYLDTFYTDISDEYRENIYKLNIL